MLTHHLVLFNPFFFNFPILVHIFIRLTHWKHAFLLLDHVVKIVTDDVITGLLVIRQNPLWRRHFLIDLELAIGEKYTCAKTYLMWR